MLKIADIVSPDLMNEFSKKVSMIISNSDQAREFLKKESFSDTELRYMNNNVIIFTAQKIYMHKLIVGIALALVEAAQASEKKLEQRYADEIEHTQPIKDYTGVV